MNSSKLIVNSPEVSNFNWLFLKLDRFNCNNLPVRPDHSPSHLGNIALHMIFSVILVQDDPKLLDDDGEISNLKE